MERPKNSSIRHGMDSCARYGCTRPECIRARRRTAQIRYHEQKTGGARVETDEVEEYAGKLVNAGMSAVDISNRSGISVTQVRGILRGDRGRVLRVTADAILGIPMPGDDCMPETDGFTSALGASRRLQALSVQGFPLPPMADGTGMTGRTISLIRAGARDRIKVSGLRKVIALHDRLWDEDPLAMGLASSAVTRAKQWAAEQGWWPTEAWKDIDDPGCKPVLKTPRYVILTEDARELMDQHGYTRKTAAERLGVKTDTLTSAMSYYEKAKSA